MIKLKYTVAKSKWTNRRVQLQLNRYTQMFAIISMSCALFFENPPFKFFFITLFKRLIFLSPYKCFHHPLYRNILYCFIAIMSKKSINQKSSPKKLNENELIRKCMERVQASNDELITTTKSLVSLTETGIRKTDENSKCVQVSIRYCVFVLLINFLLIGND